MCNGRLFTIGILAVSPILVILLMTYANTADVNAENTELEDDAVSEGGIGDKITKVEGYSIVFLTSSPNAEGSEREENDDECQDNTDCSNRNSDENEDIKGLQSSTKIPLPFP
jgi:hypothetical protein